VIKNAWAGLRDGCLDAAQIFEQHTALVNQLLDLTAHAGDTSNLILDPDLDSFYLMDVVVVKVPDLTETLGLLRDQASGIAAIHTLSEEQKIASLI